MPRFFRDDICKPLKTNILWAGTLDGYPGSMEVGVDCYFGLGTAGRVASEFYISLQRENPIMRGAP